MAYDNGPYFAEIAGTIQGRQQGLDTTGQSGGSGGANPLDAASPALSNMYVRTEINQINKIGYRFNDQAKIYLLLTANRIVYLKSDQYDRDSHGSLFATGLDFPLLSNVLISSQFGFLTQQFADPRFERLGKLVGQFKATWKVAEQWTWQGYWNRSASELISPGIPAVLATTWGTALTHNYSEALLFEARVERQIQTAVQAPTTYRLWAVSFGSQYKMSEQISLELGYKFQRQKTTDASQNFREHNVGLGATYKF